MYSYHPAEGVTTKRLQATRTEYDPTDKTRRVRQVRAQLAGPIRFIEVGGPEYRTQRKIFDL